MPIYEYKCGGGHQFERIELAGDSPDLKPQCPFCHGEGLKMLSVPKFKLSWVPVMVDSAKEIWDGTPLEGTDGINTAHYKSDKIFVDQGKT